MAISTSVTRPLLLITRFMQWSSAVIVMGLVSYFINRGPRGQHIIYQEVIATMSVAFFLPAFLSPFMPSVLSKFVLAIDVIFSYLWLTAFIFAAQDYNWHDCRRNAPPGLGCSRKKASESFIFLAFIFTFFGMILEVFQLWAYRQGNPPREKNGGAATA
ncbi:hypothetical protein VTN00DRAFT_3015 [Thermoascus crustaceus]|uniref:uncharacterized protein n=1 Tax=Thermoascus crustaceus TaxID=5088 RepID=UPI003742E5A9